jgi:magnesium transporter
LERASSHATLKVPIAEPQTRVADVLAQLRGQRYDVASQIAVCETGRLVALVSMEELLAADGDTPVGKLGDHDPPAVAPHADQELAVRKAIWHGESSLAVVNADGEFRGLIPADRLLAVLLWEHDEDIARFGGLLKGTAEARAASEAPVRGRFWHRIPWLMVGLAGALVSVDIIRSFQREIEKEVSLAFFVPAVVYLADAVGTQTEAIAIRGMPAGVTIRRMFIPEVLTGVLLGIALGLVFFPMAFWRWGQGDVALAVSVALCAACSIASLVAIALPWCLQQAGLDPAFGSGPLATVIQDLLSIIVYFLVAVLIVD